MQLSLLSSLLALPLALGAAPTVVKVGEGSSLTFSPSTVTVPVGGVVEFHFYPMKHSVAQGTFEDPCKPLSNSSFWSGAFATSDPKGNATTFSITVKDDKPIYFYCAFPSHCGSGMVGIVNAPSDTSKGLEAYKANAKDKTTVASTKVQGGLVGPAVAGGSASGSALAPSSTSSSGGGYGGSPEPAPSVTPVASGAEKIGVWGTGLFAVMIAGLTV